MNKLIQNTATAVPNVLCNQFQRITANLTKAVRHDKIGDIEYLVVPTIMMVEGVHSGSGGALLYLKEELEKIPEIWNHKPVVVYHPFKNGLPASACSADILNSRQVGILLNTTFADSKLKTEVWLDVKKTKKVDKRVLEAIENEDVMEVSTGLFTDNEAVEGEWNGEKYEAIARNYRPDHLALLPDQKGACSVEDGAGFLRLNSEGDFVLNPGVDVPKTGDYIHVRIKNPDLFTDNLKTITLKGVDGVKAVVGKLKKPPKGQEDSMVVQTFLFDKEKWTAKEAEKWVKEHQKNNVAINFGYYELQRILQSLLNKTKKDAWIEEVYDSAFVFRENNKLYKQSYDTTETGANFVGSAEEVVKIVMYKTLDGKKVKLNKENIMNKEEIVNALIEQNKALEENKEVLMALDEDVLQKLMSAKKEVKPEEAKPQTPAVNTEQPKTVEDYINAAPTEMKEVLTNSLSTYKQRKAKLVSGIMANKKSTFTKEQLEKMAMPDLEALANLAIEEKPENIDRFDGMGNVPEANAEDRFLSTPEMNFSK